MLIDTALKNSINQSVLRDFSYNCWSWYSSCRTLKHSLTHYWFSSNCFCFRAEANVCEHSSLFHRNKSFLGEISWLFSSLCSCMLFVRTISWTFVENSSSSINFITMQQKPITNKNSLFSRFKIFFFSRHKISLWRH